MSTRGADTDLADTRFMSAAIAYARRGLGVTAPNPAVGSIIVKDGVIYSEPRANPSKRGAQMVDVWFVDESEENLLEGLHLSDDD